MNQPSAALTLAWASISGKALPSPRGWSRCSRCLVALGTEGEMRECERRRVEDRLSSVFALPDAPWSWESRLEFGKALRNQSCDVLHGQGAREEAEPHDGRGL